MSAKSFWSSLLVVLSSLSFIFLSFALSPPNAQMSPLLVSAAATPLTFANRLACQTTIEQLYWDATLWPETNPQAKLDLYDVLSTAQIEAQLRETLAQSVALESVWNMPITGEMLQAEMERMAAYSQSPERLQAIFAALDHDPEKIAECLVRPRLVQRLIQQQVNHDPALHATTRAQAAAALAPIHTGEQLARLPNAQTITWAQGDPMASSLGEAIVLDEPLFAGRQDEIKNAFNLAADDPLPLNQISTLQEDATRFYALVVTAQDETQITIIYATWPKQTSTAWWSANQHRFNPEQFVQPVYTYYLPSVAEGEPSFNPANNSWQYLPAMPWHTGDSRSVWTGSVMLVWGGAYTTNGYRYDPVLDDWRPITTLDAPLGRFSFTAVWSGTEMIVFGGCSGHIQFCTLGSGGRYNPITDSWTPIAPGSLR